jgi:hypothetical protein
MTVIAWIVAVKTARPPLADDLNKSAPSKHHS